MAERISVSTSTSQHYEIFVGEHLSARLVEFLQTFSSGKLLVVIDEQVRGSHRWLEELFSEHFSEVLVYEIPPGEKNKSMEAYSRLIDFILHSSPERNTPLLAIGGGVIGDLAGFAASTVLRGIPLIHIPTTLLAMVDSSIGGKTGINHAHGKNLIGTFYQPRAVFADVRFLHTLPRAEWVNGISEILKYGFIHSPEIFDELKHLLHPRPAFDDGKAWIPLIHKSMSIKAEIIQEDVLETGRRSHLNFGHTFAHVIELTGGYEQFSHGQAVFAGMMAAIFTSNTAGAEIDMQLLKQFRYLYDFSLSGIEESPAGLTALMMRDKKVAHKKLNLILLKALGKPYVLATEDRELPQKSWEYIIKEFN